MSHLYIHIPFCATKCPYCDFFSMATKKWHPEFVEALLAEAEIRKNECREPLKTLYFGGGTPSLLLEQEFERLISGLRNSFNFRADAEITLEANPDDITPQKLRCWKNMGVNRLSIGVQSFDNEELKYLGRRHDAARAQKAIEEAQQAGIENISIDLIHGLPDSNPEVALQNIEKTKELGVQHLSMYSLTIESGSILHQLISKGKSKNTDEDFQAESYIRCLEKAEACGFKQYEISNFCHPGFESRHNSAYWNGAPYIGLGPSAHSFDGTTRSWNVADLQKYRTAIAESKRDFESETLSETDRYNEFLLTRLRMTQGFELSELSERFGGEALQGFLNSDFLNENSKLFHRTSTSISLSKAGLLLADRIISELMK